MYLPRPSFESEILNAIAANPVTAILGSRQCGKTTIAREIALRYTAQWFDLDDPSDFELLKKVPKQLLEPEKELIIIDEIQRIPELFPVIRVLSDKPERKGRFLILGSASPELMRNASDSLAGRIGFIDLTGFVLEEVQPGNVRKLWLRGGFPRSYFAESDTQSFQWRQDFIRTFLERDLNQLGINIPAYTFRRFWTMLAHYHGQIWNGAEFARSLSVSEPTVKRYLDILTGAFMIRQLQPWHENLNKRQVKSPKVYIRDSGLAHALLSLENEQVMLHPKAGASWEGFVIEQILYLSHSRDVYFWRTHSGAELDLFILKNGKRFGFEVKFSETPVVSKNMHQVIDDLHLESLFLIYSGNHMVPLDEKITLVPVTNLTELKF
jgi:uncharacterized protein